MIKNSFFCFFFVSFLFSGVLIHDFGNKKLFDYDFFYEYPKNQWILLDETKKEGALDDFLRKEFTLQRAEELGLHFSPDVFSMLEERKKQLAVNHYYERFVALPLVENFYLESVKKNLTKELFVHHVLFGYEGCALEGSFPTKTKALELASAFSLEVDSVFSSAASAEEKALAFASLALEKSQDPSVVNNKGSLGWVSWGRSVDEFQVPLFLVEEGGVSSPILTPYGFHVVYVEKQRPSDFSFYPPLVLDDFSNKAGLQSLDFDLLRSVSAKHDSSLLKNSSYSLNVPFVDGLIEDLGVFLEDGGLRGGKKNYLSFLEKHRNSGVLFVVDGRGFGVGWLINKIKETPSTRIPPFDGREGFDSMVSSFVLQDKVFSLAKEKNIFQHPLVVADFNKHKKNIMYNAYIEHKSSALSPVDSSLVESKYQEGLLDSLYFTPKQAVVYSLNFSSLEKAESVLGFLFEGQPFESYLEKHSSGTNKKTIPYGKRGELGEVAFSLKVGDTSGIIKNPDKTFSIIKVLDFLPEEKTNLSLVYSQIEKKILKQQKKDMKISLLENLKKHFNYSFDIKELY